jgi:carbon monoxide dehydrogenase subunit G
MTYEVTTWEPGRRVVLDGAGSNVVARDEIRFEPTATGTRVDYTADIRLTGWMRLAEPFAGGAFERIATDAAAGMQRALGERAEARAR